MCCSKFLRSYPLNLKMHLPQALLLLYLTLTGSSAFTVPARVTQNAPACNAAAIRSALKAKTWDSDHAESLKPEYWADLAQKNLVCK